MFLLSALLNPAKLVQFLLVLIIFGRLPIVYSSYPAAPSWKFVLIKDTQLKARFITVNGVTTSDTSLYCAAECVKQPDCIGFSFDKQSAGNPCILIFGIETFDKNKDGVVHLNKFYAKEMYIFKIGEDWYFFNQQKQSGGLSKSFCLGLKLMGKNSCLGIRKIVSAIQSVADHLAQSMRDSQDSRFVDASSLFFLRTLVTSNTCDQFCYTKNSQIVNINSLENLNQIVSGSSYNMLFMELDLTVVADIRKSLLMKHYTAPAYSLCVAT
ncbi:uncharacterized protein LOC141903324 [Tubulanus polymorphus]|uniref:uncharacterized protein LOC141903324 n=1 Tax=Tubulanus polymorphus TaxID=672921 RepID=UPI003DA3A1E5